MHSRRVFLFFGVGFLALILFLIEMFLVVSNSAWIQEFDNFWIGYIRVGFSATYVSILAFLTHLGSFEFVLIAMILVVLFLLFRKKFVLSFWFIGTTVVCVILLKLLKGLVARPRPDAYDWLIGASGFSYPSGHSVGSSFFYGLIGLFLILIFSKTWLRLCIGALSLFMIVFIMYTRVYLGVHYPSDVLGGFLFGIALVFLSTGFYFLFSQKIHIFLKKYGVDDKTLLY